MGNALLPPPAENNLLDVDRPVPLKYVQRALAGLQPAGGDDVHEHARPPWLARVVAASQRPSPAETGAEIAEESEPKKWAYAIVYRPLTPEEQRAWPHASYLVGRITPFSDLKTVLREPPEPDDQ